jgi:hypothetical protein
LVVVILLALSEIPEILDAPVSKTGIFSSVKLGSAE